MGITRTKSLRPMSLKGIYDPSDLRPPPLSKGGKNITPPEKGETGQFTGEGVIFPKRGVIICTKH